MHLLIRNCVFFHLFCVYFSFGSRSRVFEEQFSPCRKNYYFIEKRPFFIEKRSLLFLKKFVLFRNCMFKKVCVVWNGPCEWFIHYMWDGSTLKSVVHLFNVIQKFCLCFFRSLQTFKDLYSTRDKKKQLSIYLTAITGFWKRTTSQNHKNHLKKVRWFIFTNAFVFFFPGFQNQCKQ